MLRVYYDGDCGFCSEVARWFGRLDRKQNLRFEPLAAASDSIIVEEPGGRRFVRAQAVRRLLAELGGGWKLLAIAGGLVPLRAADSLYDAVARRRRHICAIR